MDYMLTTIDNPYNPFTNYDEWYEWDISAGYNTTGFLARIVRTSDALAPPAQDQAIESAIDEIVSENVLGIYVKVSESSFETMRKNSTKIP